MKNGPAKENTHHNTQNLWILPHMTSPPKRKVFTDVIQLKILRWRDYPGLCGWALSTIIYILERGRWGNGTIQERRWRQSRDLKHWPWRLQPQLGMSVATRTEREPCRKFRYFLKCQMYNDYTYDPVVPLLGIYPKKWKHMLI